MTDWLSEVYAASGDQKKLEEIYSKWAVEYDVSLAALGYMTPAVACATLAQLVDKRDAPILDVGAGTGVLGAILNAVGYSQIVGIDMTQSMLDRATEKKVYSELRRRAVGVPLDFEDGRFSAAISTGVFTIGHAPASGFDEIARVVAPGGLFVTSLTGLDEPGNEYREKFEAMEKAGIWRLERVSNQFISMPNADAENAHHSEVYAFRVI